MPAQHLHVRRAHNPAPWRPPYRGAVLIILAVLVVLSGIAYIFRSGANNVYIARRTNREQQ